MPDRSDQRLYGQGANMKKQYLSDGVYVSIVPKDALYPVVLTAGHHDEAQADHVIFMELTAIEQLFRLCKEEGIL